MPDCVAHYCFGQDVLGLLDAEPKACAAAHKEEFDMGLQGPDIFFSYKPWRKNSVRRYGAKWHRQSAASMFGPLLAAAPKGAQLSYLLGLICHFALDACCHPYINQNSPRPGDHDRIEAAYDRYLLLQHSGIRSRASLVRAAGLDLHALSACWPDMPQRLVKTCVRSMCFFLWLLDKKWPVVALETLIARPRSFSTLSMPKSVPKAHKKHMPRLDALYARALGLAVQKIRLACTALGKTPAGLAGFEMNYEGVVAHEQA